MYNTNKMLLYYMYGEQRINVKEFLREKLKIILKKNIFLKSQIYFRSLKNRIKGKTGENGVKNV